MDLGIVTQTEMSRPVWGAWIEMRFLRCRMKSQPRRAPYGARGLKFWAIIGGIARAGVAPRMGRVD